jgi:hypothetical protein
MHLCKGEKLVLKLKAGTEDADERPEMQNKRHGHSRMGRIHIVVGGNFHPKRRGVSEMCCRLLTRSEMLPASILKPIPKEPRKPEII